jgi:competence ComEA-like helix-hairpin-helix protein
MQISKFGKDKLKSFLSSVSLRSGVRNPPSFRFFSHRQQCFLLLLGPFALALLYIRLDFPSSPLSTQERDREVVVEVLGEVRYPGILLFRNSPTPGEAVERAGGPIKMSFPNGDSSSLPLETGTLLTVVKENPRQIRITLGRMEARKRLVFSIPLDLNQATMEDLRLISGVGESLAGEIIAYRERRRAFRSVDELKEVNGIGDKNYPSLKPFVTVK